MLLPDAYRIVQKVIEPVSLDEFFDRRMGSATLRIPGGPDDFRAELLGSSPDRLLLDDFDRLAPKITCHAAAPTGPPPVAERVSDPEAFLDKIRAFHARGYTVRLPEVRSLSPPLEEFLRALEAILHQPVSAEVFWSDAAAKAPVHHDDYDIVVVHLVGEKLWSISTDRSPLPNQWKTIPEGPPNLGRYEDVKVGPGDLLYLPRGTPHKVEAITESLHLSIGFVPLTVREAIIAALDHLSDLDRPLRESVAPHMGAAVRRNEFGALPARVKAGAAKLASACQSDDFIAQALQRRSSRVVGKLEKLKRGQGGAITRDSVVKQNPLAVCHLMANSSKIDFSFPGDHQYIHKGAEKSVLFVANTPEFRVRDIPGDIGDDVRIALVEKLVTSGFLELVQE